MSADGLQSRTPLRLVLLALWMPFWLVLLLIRRFGLVVEILLAAIVAFSLATTSDPFVGRVADAAVGGLRSAWALLAIDTSGTLRALALTSLKMLPGVAAVVVLATRLRGWERLRWPMWAFLSVWLFPLACLLPSTPPRILSLIALTAISIRLSRHRSLRWTVMLPLVLYVDLFFLHLLSHPPFHWSLPDPFRAVLAERCRSNDGQRPLNLRDSQLGAHYVAVSALRPDELLLSNAGSFEPPWKVVDAADDRTSWWLRRQGEGWIFDGRSSVAGDMQNGCLIGDELWLNDADQHFVAGVKRDAQSGKEDVRYILMDVHVNNMSLPVCRPDRQTVIISEVMSGTRMWEVKPATGAIRQMRSDQVGLHWAPRAYGADKLTINDTSDLMVYSLDNERVLDRVPAGIFMLNRHERCDKDGAVATADMTGRVRLFRLDSDGRYRFDWGISLSSPRNVTFSADCRFLGVTSMDDTTVTLLDLQTREVIATYKAGPVLREITFLGERELAVTDACTMTTFRF